MRQYITIHAVQINVPWSEHRRLVQMVIPMAWVSLNHVTGMADAAPGMQQSLLRGANASSMHLNNRRMHVGEGDKRGQCCFWCRPVVLADLLGDAGGR